MDGTAGFVSELQRVAEEEPLLAVALGAALVAFATTPLAFAVLGRMQWFETRRGRTLQRPGFAWVVASMSLVMTIPAIFSLLALKSRHYDHDRYEFDPNRTLSVLDQGRQYASLKEADEAVRAERKYLETARQELVDSIKQLDTTMLALRAAAGQHPATYEALPAVLDSLAVVHKQIGLDAPQQLLDEMAPPADLPPAPLLVMAPAAATAPSLASLPGTSATAPAAVAGHGISPAVRQVELASVPEPQRALAEMLPLSDVPAGWVIGEMDGKHLETFNAENLYEKINGRAESFMQYDVRGMAYAYYHPQGDESSEAQLYIYEMGGPLKAFGKYSSEKPVDFEPVDVGDEGYTSAGSVFFYSGPYYTQIVTTSEDPKLAGFALEIARSVAARQAPGGAVEAPSLAAAAGTPSPPPAPIPAPEPPAPASDEGDAMLGPGEVFPAEVASAAPAPSAPAAPIPAPATPAQLFKLLPAGPNRSAETFAAQDVFGYSFFTDVFVANYEDEGVEWQGFLRPYGSPEAAAAILDEYVAGVKEFGGTVEEVEAEGVDRMVLGEQVGLHDAIFLKGNTLAGVSGATEREPAERFASEFARTLPASVPAIETDDAPAEIGATAEGGADGES